LENILACSWDIPARTRVTATSQPSPVFPIKIVLGCRSHIILRDPWEDKRENDG
jgi:hypothetical protein